MIGLQLTPATLVALQNERAARPVVGNISLQDRARHHVTLAVDTIDAVPQVSLAHSSVAAVLLALAALPVTEAMHEADLGPAARSSLRTILAIVADPNLTGGETRARVQEVLTSAGIY